MNTPDSPPDLVIVVADADAEQLLAALLKRGLERECLRPVRWVIRRDPMRDAALCQHPTKALVDVNSKRTKVLIAFDHHGSGREQSPARDVEEEVVRTLERSGFDRANVACVVLEPELECVLGSVWERLAEVLAKRRNEPVPARHAVLVKAGLLPAHQGDAELHWSRMLIQHPKECLDGLLRLLRLRHEPALFGDLGKLLSLRELKGSATGARIASILVAWFGTVTEGDCDP